MNSLSLVDVLGSPPAPAHNPTTAAGATLGRRLFFERRLSSDGRVACATCHDPGQGFTTPEAHTRRGVSGRTLDRHTPTLLNVGWATTGLFWDGGAKNLESLSLGPLTHPDEMGNTAGLAVPIARLEQDATYPQDFAAAFGDSAITGSRVLWALAQFQRTLVPEPSPVDHAEQGECRLDAPAALGAEVFAQHCARCHRPPLFTDRSFHNNGLDTDFPSRGIDPRRGRARISLDEQDLGKYKTPTLRGLESTAPYMHDGRFPTLQAVVAHYRFGMKASASLDPVFRLADGRLGVDISDAEAAALTTFLRTLSTPLAARVPIEK